MHQDSDVTGYYDGGLIKTVDRPEETEIEKGILDNLPEERNHKMSQDTVVNDFYSVQLTKTVDGQDTEPAGDVIGKFR
jgi:hypothetical protein